MGYEALHLISLCGPEVPSERTSPDTQSCGHRSRTQLQPSPEGAVLKGLLGRFCFKSLVTFASSFLSVPASGTVMATATPRQIPVWCTMAAPNLLDTVNVYTVRAKGEGVEGL